MLAETILALTMSATPPDLCAGLVQDRNPRPMNHSVPMPPPGGSYVDPSFGTTIRRISNAAANPGEAPRCKVVKPSYSTMPVFNADESLLLLWHRCNGHAVYDGRTYQFLRFVSTQGAAAVSDPLWHPTDPTSLYYPSVYGARSRFMRIRFDTATGQELTPPGGEVVRDFEAECGAPNWGNTLKTMSDPYWFSWDPPFKIGFRCGTDKRVYYDLTNDVVLANHPAPGTRVAPMPFPSGSMWLVGETARRPENGTEVRLRHLGIPGAHAALGRTADGRDFLAGMVYDNCSQKPDQCGDADPAKWVNVSGNVIIAWPDGQGGRDKDGNPWAKPWTPIIAQSQGWPYPMVMAHASAHARLNPGWAAYSLTGRGMFWHSPPTDGVAVLDKELLLVDVNSPTPRWCRIGHHRTSPKGYNNEPDWTWKDAYWKEPHVNISPTGTRVVFGTDWRGGPTVDTFVVELPSYGGDVPPPPPPPPPSGACCHGGQCSYVPASGCPSDGVWHSGLACQAVTCEQPPGPPTGACCVGGGCTDLEQSQCTGTWSAQPCSQVQCGGGTGQYACECTIVAEGSVLRFPCACPSTTG